MTCQHLVVEELNRQTLIVVRRCLLCGVSYNRTAFLEKLKKAIRTRYRLNSPWTAAERSEDCW